MVSRKLRAATYLTGALIASLATLVACGGGGGIPSSPMQPTNPTAPAQNQTVSIPMTQSSSVALPVTGGITSTVTLSQNNAPAGATLAVSVSSRSSLGMPDIPASNASAFEYFAFTPSTDVTFNGFPKIKMSLQSAPKNQGSFYAWMYNVASGAWTDLGIVTVSGTTMSFGGGSSSITLRGGATYVAAPFTGNVGASCPIPSATPSSAPTTSPSAAPSVTPVPCITPPVATPGPTPTGTKLYVSNGCNGHGFMTVFDQSGNLIPVTGTFPGMVSQGAIAFDALNGELYVGGTGEASLIEAFDQSGTELATTGTFPTPNSAAPSALAFDPNNRHLYAAFATAINEMRVYDENGNLVSTGGDFPNLNNPSAIAFDTSNRQFYVTNAGNNTVTVYDEDGNQIATTGAFTGLNQPYGIAFDSVNSRLYATSVSGPTLQAINIYDESGNLVTAVAVQGAPAGALQSIAFDATNQHLYVTTGPSGNGVMLFPGTVIETDQSGNVVLTSGKFSQVIFPQGIAIVP